VSDLVVRAEGLTRVFHDFWGRPRVTAVAGLNLSLQRGEVVGLLGPNGAGKSTTVKLLLGLLRPTAGSIEVLGRPPRDVAAKERVGYLPEESYLWPFLTGAETLAFFARLFDRGAPPERVAELLETVGLSGAADRRVGEYSKGMQRRVGLAQALINDPDLVILDEPTSGLDPLGRRDVKAIIAELAARGKTVLLCSHLLAEVEDVCHRVVILVDGRAVAGGALGELLAEPGRARLDLPAVDEPTAVRLLNTVREVIGEGDVHLQTPQRSLESYFLEVIARARSGGGAP
jgi:ABC-2 type transport system ATP-binding protein